MGVVGAFAEDEAGAVTGESTWVLVFLSRSLNVLTGGSHRELFCARAHRKGWALCWYIDALFRVIRADDREHCRACFLGDKRFRQRANSHQSSSRGKQCFDLNERAIRQHAKRLA
jgi:hypothetical protein